MLTGTEVRGKGNENCEDNESVAAAFYFGILRGIDLRDCLVDHCFYSRWI